MRQPFDHPDLPDEPFYGISREHVTIRLRYQMAFHSTCGDGPEHRDHPQGTITFAKDAILGGVKQPDGDVVVDKVYAGHSFRFLPFQYYEEPAR
jgi:hypothetical protein